MQEGTCGRCGAKRTTETHSSTRNEVRQIDACHQEVLCDRCGKVIGRTTSHDWEATEETETRTRSERGGGPNYEAVVWTWEETVVITHRRCKKCGLRESEEKVVATTEDTMR
jgi:hypothetical protein